MAELSCSPPKTSEIKIPFAGEISKLAGGIRPTGFDPFRGHHLQVVDELDEGAEDALAGEESLRGEACKQRRGGRGGESCMG